MFHPATTAVLTALLLIAMPGLAAAQDLTGRWRLLAAEDLRADGTVARRPWGAHPVGTIVVEGGFCYVQIMSSDVPTFVAGDHVLANFDTDQLEEFLREHEIRP